MRCLKWRSLQNKFKGRIDHIDEENTDGVQMRSRIHNGKDKRLHDRLFDSTFVPTTLLQQPKGVQEEVLISGVEKCNGHVQNVLVRKR